MQYFSRGVANDCLINRAIGRFRSNIIPVLTALVAVGLAVVTPSSILRDNSNNRKNVAPGTFSLTGSMNTARALHTSTAINTGEFLVAGGIAKPSRGESLASGELFNAPHSKMKATA